ncbi:MAG: hypothetical protein ACRC42_03985 [Mycoplasma sp.]
MKKLNFINNNSFIAKYKNIKKLPKLAKSTKWIIFIFEELYLLDDSFDIHRKATPEVIEASIKMFPPKSKILLVGKVPNLIQSYRLLKSKNFKVYISKI